MLFTSVRGHVYSQELPESTKQWNSYDNKKILDRKEVPVNSIIKEDQVVVAKNIENSARGVSMVVLWLDCDREGEAIAFEVIKICQKINRNVRFKRARFAALTPTDIWNAYNHLA